jgi:hypothetical protein
MTNQIQSAPTNLVSLTTSTLESTNSAKFRFQLAIKEREIIKTDPLWELNQHQPNDAKGMLLNNIRDRMLQYYKS